MASNWGSFINKAKKVEEALRIKGEVKSETIIDIEDATDPNTLNPRILSRTFNDANGNLSVLKRIYNDRGDLSFESYETDSETEKSYEKNICYNYGTNYNYKETITNEIGGLILEEETIQRDICTTDDGKKETIIEKYYHRYGSEKDDGNFQHISMIENLYDDNHNLIIKKDAKGTKEICKYDEFNRLVYKATLQDNTIAKEEFITYSDDGSRIFESKYYVNGKLNHIHKYIYDEYDREIYHLYHGDIQNGIFTSHRHFVRVYDDDGTDIYLSDISDDGHYIIRRMNHDGGYIWYTTKDGKLIKFEKEISTDYLRMHLSCNIVDDSIELYLEEAFEREKYERIPNKINIFYERIPNKINIFYEGIVNLDHYDEIISEDVNIEDIKQYLKPTSYCEEITDGAGVRTSTNHFGDYSSIRKTYPPINNERRVEIFTKRPVINECEIEKTSIESLSDDDILKAAESICKDLKNNVTTGSMEDDIVSSLSNLFFK